MKDDIVLEFGPINSSNFKSLQDIASTVRACVNTDITLTVLRNGGTRHRLLLKPQPFDGQGLVGCYFLNVENVERWICTWYRDTDLSSADFILETRVACNFCSL